MPSKDLGGIASLLAFAEARGKKKRPCWTCEIPQRYTLEEAYALGKRFRVMVEWLRTNAGGDHGEEATTSRVQKHFEFRHHIHTTKK